MSDCVTNKAFLIFNWYPCASAYLTTYILLQSDKGLGAAELTCRLCDKRLGSSSALLRHLRLQHSADTPPGVECSPTPCAPCTVCRCGRDRAASSPPERTSPASGGTDEQSGSVTGHTAEDRTVCRPAPSAANQTPVQDQLACAACPERFASAAQRRLHQRREHPLPLPHVCRLCGKRFPSPSKLRIHENSHAGAKPHVCEVCGRRYHSAQKLHVHARSHTGERPFVCHMCGRTFASAAYLAQHELTHSGRRPHQCNLCGKQFTQRGTMTKHVRNVHSTLAGQSSSEGAARGVTIVTGPPGTGAVPIQKLDTLIS